MSDAQWLDHARRVGKEIGDSSDAEPVTFLLGAAMSYTSGAPTREQVVAVLSEADGEHDVPEQGGPMRPLSRPEQQAVRRLFDDAHIAPHVGYRCLAALGRSRKVIVVTLAWDDAMEQACQLLGVPHQALSLRTSPREEVAAALSAPNTLVVLHVNGALAPAGELQYAPHDSPWPLHPEERRLLESALSTLRVVAGFPFTSKAKMTGMFEEAEIRVPHPVDAFVRTEQRAGRHEHGTPVRLADEVGEHFARAMGVNFDRMMETILATASGTTFPDRPTECPGAEHFVTLRADLVRPHLDAPVLLIPGEPSLGKTTLAELIAGWQRLWWPGTEIVRESGPRAALAQLEAASTAPDDGPRRVVILENVFGGEDRDAVDQALAHLQTHARLHDPRVRFVATSQLTQWFTASERAAAGRPLETISPAPAAWYDAADPQTLAVAAEHESTGRRDAIDERITLGELSTPSRVAAFARTATDSTDAAVIEDKVAVLAASWAAGDRSHAARLAVLVRLQELATTTTSADELRARAGASDMWEADDLLCSAFVGSHTFDGVEYLRLAHHTDRIAIDQFLEVTENVAPALIAAGCDEAWTKATLTTWRSVRSLLEDPKRVRELREKDPEWWTDLLLERGPQMLEDAARRGLGTTSKLLGELETLEHDFWSLRELVYEVIAGWEAFDEQKGAATDFIEDVLEKRRLFGCYAAFEACTYLRFATPPYVRQVTTARVHRLVMNALRGRASDNEIREVALIFDAVLWLPPPLQEGDHHDLMSRIIDACATRPSLAGGLAVASLFHPVGIEAAGITDPVHLVTRGDVDQVTCAAHVVKWHFLHQSRGRALFNRRLLESECSGYLNRQPSDEALKPDEEQRIVRALEVLGTGPDAGWIFHLGMNLRCTTGVFSTKVLVKMLANIDEGDDGVLTAALTYKAPPELIQPLRAYCQKPGSRTGLQEILGGGVTLDVGGAQTDVGAPRFRFTNAGDEVWKELRLGDTTLEGAFGWNFLNEKPSDIAVLVEAALADAEADGHMLDRRARAELLRLIRAGNLIPLSMAYTGRGADDVLNRSRALVETVARAVADLAQRRNGADDGA